jgi:hypothetical protein
MLISKPFGRCGNSVDRAHDFAGAAQLFDRPVKNRKAIIALRKTRWRGAAVRDFGKQNRGIPDVSKAIDSIISQADAASSTGPGNRVISPNRTNSAARQQAARDGERS